MDEFKLYKSNDEIPKVKRVWQGLDNSNVSPDFEEGIEYDQSGGAWWYPKENKYSAFLRPMSKFEWNSMPMEPAQLRLSTGKENQQMGLAEDGSFISTEMITKQLEGIKKREEDLSKQRNDLKMLTQKLIDQRKYENSQMDVLTQEIKTYTDTINRFFTSKG